MPITDAELFYCLKKITLHDTFFLILTFFSLIILFFSAEQDHFYMVIFERHEWFEK